MKKWFIFIFIFAFLCSCSNNLDNSFTSLSLYEVTDESFKGKNGYITIETLKDVYSVADSTISYKRVVSAEAPENGISVGVHSMNELHKYENNKWYKIPFKMNYTVIYLSLNLPQNHSDVVDINLEDYFDCLPLPAGQYRIVYEGAVSNTFTLE